MTYLGVDVGAKGGISWITRGMAYSEPYSDRLLLSVCSSLRSVCAVVEKVHAMPSQGVCSMFTFGKSYGFILGVFEAYKIDYTEARPQEWKKEFDLIGTDKKASIERCKELFPNVSLLPTSRCRKESDGMAESLLMAEYCRRLQQRKYKNMR